MPKSALRKCEAYNRIRIRSNKHRIEYLLYIDLIPLMPNFECIQKS